MSQKGMVNGVVVTNAIQNWNANSETRLAAACPGLDPDDPWTAGINHNNVLLP
jgi:hypothetical protein